MNLRELTGFAFQRKSSRAERVGEAEGSQKTRSKTGTVTPSAGTLKRFA